jgi:predicted transcriptional regulator
MPAPPLRLRLAKQSGETLVRQLKIGSLPIDPFSIAQQHEIHVEAKPDCAEGVSAMLLRYGNSFGIFFATHIKSEGFQRFSIAHELGHYFLEGHMDHVLKDGCPHVSQAGFTSSDPYELEADNFAAGLLMPSTLFSKAMSRLDAGLSAIEDLAAQCRTSLTATAIRYAELSREPIAVILSTANTVDFCRLSESMKGLSNFDWLRRCSPVPTRTGTAAFNAAPGRVAQSHRETLDIDVADWLAGDRSIPCREEMVGLGSYGKTLTVLTCGASNDDSADDGDEETEETMVEHFDRRYGRRASPS